MIKFFRQIRYKLMNENKTSRYLKYAIGEIILVVFGILIALQINNWNENRKDSVQEIAILKSLQNDIQSDLRDLQYSIEFKKKMLIEYNNCLAILTDKQEGTKEEFWRRWREERMP